jgi:hypothetical protein
MNDKVKRELMTLELAGGIAGWLWFAALGLSAYYFYAAIFSQGLWWQFGCAALAAFVLYHYSLSCQLQRQKIWQALQAAEAAVEAVPQTPQKLMDAAE